MISVLPYNLIKSFVNHFIVMLYDKSPKIQNFPYIIFIFSNNDYINNYFDF